MVRITQEKQILSFIFIVVPQKQKLRTIRNKTDAKGLEKMKNSSAFSDSLPIFCFFSRWTRKLSSLAIGLAFIFWR